MKVWYSSIMMKAAENSEGAAHAARAEEADRINRETNIVLCVACSVFGEKILLRFESQKYFQKLEGLEFEVWI
eukprot:g51840.t1